MNQRKKSIGIVSTLQITGSFVNKEYAGLDKLIHVVQSKILQNAFNKIGCQSSRNKMKKLKQKININQGLQRLSKVLNRRFRQRKIFFLRKLKPIEILTNETQPSCDSSMFLTPSSQTKLRISRNPSNHQKQDIIAIFMMILLLKFIK
ncbi:hypothetical protein pb186bvf_017691 [Paramecium bursaria]